MSERYDVAIVGGGPAGSTCGSLLRKYEPGLRVAIVERSPFPREHVGESLLPAINAILWEMGCWHKVEAAGFPIKLGATYRWGSSRDLWDFSFLAYDEFIDQPRPGAFQGQRRRVAWHVDRSIYDAILLDHAREMGCEVLQPARVVEVRIDTDRPDRVAGLTLEDGREIEAEWYVDGSGDAGIIRRALGIAVQHPAKLKNIAIWNYFRGAKWAVRVGRDATRVAVLSIGSGWIWYIPLTDDRVSVGYVCPADFYRDKGMRPADLYAWAIAQEPLVTELLAGARPEGEVFTTRDWSFVADRLSGPNWFLAGDAAGFADPILAAGLTLTHLGAREAAYAILELFRGEHDRRWLLDRFNEVMRRRIHQHVKFADFWYAANGIFTDLEAYTSQIAKESGLKLDPKAAFRWLSNGGLFSDPLGRADFSGIDLSLVKRATDKLTAGAEQTDWLFSQHNVFHLNLKGARKEEIPILSHGRIHRQPCYIREDKTLPVMGFSRIVLDALSKTTDAQRMFDLIVRDITAAGGGGPQLAAHLHESMQALEVMLIDGWVWGQRNPKKPTIRMSADGVRSGSIIPDAGQGLPREVSAAT